MPKTFKNSQVAKFCQIWSHCWPLHSFLSLFSSEYFNLHFCCYLQLHFTPSVQCRRVHFDYFYLEMTGVMHYYTNCARMRLFEKVNISGSEWETERDRDRETETERVRQRMWEIQNVPMKKRETMWDRVRERKRQCVCVCVRERERERERDNVWEREKDRLPVSEDNLFLWVYGPLRNRFILPPLLNSFLNSLTKALAWVILEKWVSGSRHEEKKRNGRGPTYYTAINDTSVSLSREHSLTL